MPIHRTYPSKKELGPVTQKFRVWLGLLVLNFILCLVFVLGAVFSILDGKMFEFFVQLSIVAVLLRECLLPHVVVHERGMRIIKLLRYRTMRWQDMESIVVGPLTVVRLKGGNRVNSHTSALADNDDKAGLASLIRRLAPDLEVKTADEQTEQRRRVNVDIVAGVLIGTAFMFCLAATLFMSGGLYSSAFPLIAAWAAFVLSLVVAGIRSEQKSQRFMALSACVVAGGAWAYYMLL